MDRLEDLLETLKEMQRLFYTGVWNGEYEDTDYYEGQKSMLEDIIALIETRLQKG